MTLNHINLVVLDVAEAVWLFEDFFDFRCTGQKGDHAIAILEGPGNFTLVIMAGKEVPPGYPTAFHIGFMQDREDQVLEVYRKLKDGGIAIGAEPRKIRDSFGFYFNFGGFMIEVGHLTR